MRAATAGSSKLHPRRRHGASTLEFALVAPIVFLVVLALIQFAGLLMCQNVLTAAVREGGRLASLPNTVSSAAVIAAVQDHANRAGISPELVTVNVNPTTLNNLPTGTEISISVSAPIRDLAWFWALAPPNGNLTAESTYQRE